MNLKKKPYCLKKKKLEFIPDAASTLLFNIIPLHSDVLLQMGKLNNTEVKKQMCPKPQSYKNGRT